MRLQLLVWLAAAAITVAPHVDAATTVKPATTTATPTTTSASSAVNEECETGGDVTLTVSGSDAVVTDSSCLTSKVTPTTDPKTGITTITAKARGIEKVVSIPSADILDLTGNAVSDIADLSSYAALKRLVLSSNGLTSFKSITWPSTLTELVLASNAIPKTVSFSKLPLQSLDLTNTSISNLSGITLPSTIQTLNLAFNQFTKFPQSDVFNSLTSLTLTTNSIASFNDIVVPPSLVSLDLSWNSLSTFDGFSIPSTVTKLYLGGNRFTSLADLKTSNPLTILYVHDLVLGNLANVTFPSTVTALSLTNCSLTTLSNVVIPSEVVYLDISENMLTEIPASYPATMKSLTASGNQLTQLHNIVFPSSTTKLIFTDNPITSVRGVQFPFVMEQLFFGSEPITEFEVRRSDVTSFQTLQNFSGTVTQKNCSNVAATTTVITTTAVKKLTLCVIADDVFEAQYGSASSGSSGSTSNSSAGWVLPVIIALAALAVIGVALFIVRRRKAARAAEKTLTQQHEAQAYNQTLANPSVFGDLPQFNSRGKNPNPQVTMMSMNMNMNNAFNTMYSGTHNSSSGSGGSNGPETSLIKYRIQTHEVTLQRALAHGGFGAVYLATYQMQDVVVKKILPEKASDDRCLAAFLDEIKLNSTLNHPKIVRFIGVSWNTLSDIAVIMEYMSNGDLDTLLKQQYARRKQGTPLEEFGWYESLNLPCRSALALDVLDAIVYLHSFSSPIIHRDLKAKNVLLSHTYEAKLSDFGVSKEWRVDATMTAGIGTMAWIAPEVLRGERYTEKADMYSFGVILTELATCAKPFEGVTNALIVLKVTSGEQKPDMGPDCPEDIRELGMRCLSYDPSDRPSAMVAHYELKTLLKAHTRFEL